MPRQEIGRREEESLERFGGRGDVANQFRILRGRQEFVRGHQFLRFQVMGDVKNGLAFPYSERQLVNMTVGNLPEYIVAGDAVVEEILAALQPTASLAPPAPPN